MNRHLFLLLSVFTVFLNPSQLSAAAMSGNSAQERFDNALRRGNPEAIHRAYFDLSDREKKKNKHKLLDAFGRKPKFKTFTAKGKRLLSRLFGQDRNQNSIPSQTALSTERSQENTDAAQVSTPSPKIEQSEPGAMKKVKYGSLQYALLQLAAREFVNNTRTIEDAITLIKAGSAGRDELLYDFARAVFFALMKKPFMNDGIEAVTDMTAFPAQLKPYFDRIEISLQDYINHGIMPRIDDDNTLMLVRMQLTSLDGIEQIQNIENITFLNASDNRITVLPDYLCRCNELQGIVLINNRLVHLPDCITNLAYLEELQLGNNNLTQLPEDIGNLQSLAILDLYENKLTTLPESLIRIPQVETIDARNNKISSLPHALFPLVMSGKLDIGGNKLNP